MQDKPCSPMSRTVTRETVFGVTNHPLVGSSLLKRVTSGESDRFYKKPGVGAAWKFGERAPSTDWEPIASNDAPRGSDAERMYWTLRAALSVGRCRILSRRTEP
jgi:hypothetical protein